MKTFGYACGTCFPLAIIPELGTVNVLFPDQDTEACMRRMQASGSTDELRARKGVVSSLTRDDDLPSASCPI